MAKNTEIVLLENSYELDTITLPEYRGRLVGSLKNLDQSLLTEQEVRDCFSGLKLIMGAFAEKISSLETDISSMRREQLAAESRMEAMYLKAQLEIQELRTELTEIKLSKGRISQIVKVAKALQGNAYAPYAVKSMVESVIGSENSKLVGKLNHSTNLPTDFSKRLEFAQRNGFKWNQNNRVPSKPAKQLQILEEWENQFCEVESMTLEQILNKSYIVGVGPGAVAGALMFLEREMGSLLPERETLSVYNCYQRAVKIFNENRHAKTLEIPCKFDVKTLVLEGFCSLGYKDRTEVQKRLETKFLGTVDQAVSGIKKLISKSTLPSFITWEEGADSDTKKLYGIQSGIYDEQISRFIKKYELKN